MTSLNLKGQGRDPNMDITESEVKQGRCCGLLYMKTDLLMVLRTVMIAGE